MFIMSIGGSHGRVALAHAFPPNAIMTLADHDLILKRLADKYAAEMDKLTKECQDGRMSGDQYAKLTERKSAEVAACYRFLEEQRQEHRKSHPQEVFYVERVKPFVIKVVVYALIILAFIVSWKAASRPMTAEEEYYAEPWRELVPP